MEYGAETDFYQGRKAATGWVLYDWANSAFSTTVMAGFFPLFFKSYYNSGVDPAESTARLGWANTVASLAIALLVPLVGAVSDAGAYKVRFLAAFTLLGSIATASLAGFGAGQWVGAAAAYVLASFCFGVAISVYDSLLPVVAKRDRVDYLSSLGYSLGYLGGGVLFLVNVLMYQNPSLFGLADGAQAVQASFLTVGVWWLAFSIPAFAWVREPKPLECGAPESGLGGGLRRSFASGTRELRRTLSGLARYKTVLLFLAAFFLYNDGVGTTIKMAVDYGLSIGFETSDLIQALLLVQFVGFPCAYLFAKLSFRFHPKQGILFSIAVYLLTLFWAFRMQQRWEFYVLAILIGAVQGGIQALSRSFFSRLIPEERSGEFYGIYNLLGKFTGLIGPIMMGTVGLWLGSARYGILSLSVLFLAGGALLLKVDEARGKRDLLEQSQA